MSPLWTERTVIFVGAEEIAAWHTPCGFRKRPEKRALRLPRESVGKPCLTELFSSLPPIQGPVDVIFSSSYVRFLIVTPNPKIKSSKERATFAQLLFQRELGLNEGSFEQRIEQESVKKPVLACALDRTMLGAVIADCGGAAKVRCATPLFVLAVNRIRRLLGDGVVAVVEPGKLTVGFIVRGEWSRIASRPFFPGDKNALRQLLEDYNDAGIGGGKCWLLDPEQVVTPPGAGWSVHPIATGESALPLAACELDA